MWLLIQSILVYSIFAYLLYRNAKSVTYGQIDAVNRSNRWYALPRGYWMCILIFMVISGLRYKVGVDHYSYLQDYLSALNGTFEERERGIEIGYLLCTRLFSFFNIHPTVYFAFLSFLQIFFVVQAQKHERDVMPYMMLVMVLGTCYLSWMNGIRQMIVACSFMWATQFIVEKNLSKYLLWMMFAFLWHRSSMLLILPFLFAYVNSVWNKRWINIAIFIVCVILGNTPSWISSMTQIEGMLSLLGYNNYAEQLSELVQSENLTEMTFGPRILVVMISCLFVIYYYPKVRAMYSNSRIDLFYKLFFIGVCSYFLFVNTSVAFQRPVQYFDIFALPMIAYTLTYLKRIGSLSYKLLVLVSMSFLFLQCYNDFTVPEFQRRATLYQFYPFFEL